MKSEFVVSAAAPEQFPKEELPEIAFLGRSNVGKSSLINALVGAKGLAFTSSQPGRTQTLNFYRVDGKMFFVDLPGYGYAKVPRETANQWRPLIEAYLRRRRSLALALIVLDARRGWMETDLQLKSWLEQYDRKYLVVATKTDKWRNQSEQHAALTNLRSEVADPVLFSALTGRGVRELWQAILKTRHNL